MRRAFTNPVNIPASWPFINTNPFDLSHFRWYMSRFGGAVRAVLVDTGVHTLFKDPSVRDYPPGFLSRYISAVVEVSRVIDRTASEAELYYVVPDIPSDYPGREVYYPWNVERTAEYAKMFLNLSKNLPGTAIAVVQGRRDDPYSTVKAYKEYIDVYGEYNYLALGPTCTSRNIRTLARQIRLFDGVVHTKFHAFGVHTRTLKYLAERRVSLCKLASIDSSSYWYDIAYRNGRGKTKEDMARILHNRISQIQDTLLKIPCRDAQAARIFSIHKN